MPKHYWSGKSEFFSPGKILGANLADELQWLSSEFNTPPFFKASRRLNQILNSHGNGLDVGGAGFGGGSVFGGNISPRRDAGSAVSFASVAARTRALRPVDETAGTVASVRMRWSTMRVHVHARNDDM